MTEKSTTKTLMLLFFVAVFYRTYKLFENFCYGWRLIIILLLSQRHFYIPEFLNEFSFVIEIRFRLDAAVFNGLRGRLVVD